MIFETNGRFFIRSKWDAILGGSLILLCAASLAFHGRVGVHTGGLGVAQATPSPAAVRFRTVSTGPELWEVKPS
jgi:hypothetical protein